MRGTFITFEGGEGAGKTTQARLLAARLEASGRRVTCAREPGGTRVADAVRAILLDPANAGLAGRAELLLHCASRADHVERVLSPALAAGDVVICDRYSDSTRAYQGGGRGVDLALVEAVDAAAHAGLVPDLTLLLDLPAEEGLARARARDEERGRARSAGRYEGEDLAFHRRVRSAFLRLAGRDPRRILVLDARGDETAVAARVEAAVRGRLPELGLA